MVVKIDIDFDGTVLWNGEAVPDRGALEARLQRGGRRAGPARGAHPAEQAGRVQVGGDRAGVGAAPRRHQDRHGRQRTVRQVAACARCDSRRRVARRGARASRWRGAGAGERCVRRSASPLQAAQELIKAQQLQGGARQGARSRSGRSAQDANETYMIERMRIAAASGAGDVETAARSFEALSGSGRISAAERLRMIESIAGSYYRARSTPRRCSGASATSSEGGTNGAIRTMLIQSQYLSGDFAGARAGADGRDPGSRARRRAARRRPPEAAAQRRARSRTTTTRYVFAMEKLVTYYPKKEYWVDLLSRMQRKPNFSDRLALDAYRLSLATGSMIGADRLHGDGAARAAGRPRQRRQAGHRQGIRSGALGTGAAGRARTSACKALVDKKLAEDKQTQRRGRAPGRRPPRTATRWSSLGMNLVYNGQAPRACS